MPAAAPASRRRPPPKSPAADGGKGWREWGLAALIFVTAFAAYGPALSGAIVWDDEWWTTNVEQLLGDFDGLRRMWTSATALQQYYPVTGVTFWVDYHLWGSWTLPYHVENVLLHLASALLFWRLLSRLPVPGAGIAAAIFALHPVMVESVAWITERKNVLSMFLFLAALLAYGRYAGFWAEAPPSHRGRFYALALTLFVLALLAKISVFAFPAVLLLMAWWKTGRVQWKQDVLPSLPFFVLAVSFGFYISWLEKHYVGAEGKDWDLTLPERLLVAGRALWFYVGKLLWPAHLSPIYVRWQLDAHSLVQWLWPVSALLTLFAAWWFRQRIGRGPLAALLFYAGSLFPLLGFMNAYGMIYSFVANRWVYVPSLGLIALAAAAFAWAMAQWPRLLAGVVMVFLLSLSVLTWGASRVYRGPHEFWAATLAENPDCWVAHFDLGNVYMSEGKVEDAIAQFTRAVALSPNDDKAYNNLGGALTQAGRFGEAMEQYEKVIQLLPDLEISYYNLGNCLFAQGRLDEAEARYRKCLALSPDHADAHTNLAFALFKKGRVDEALVQYREVTRLRPEHAEAFCNLAEMLRMAGAVREAAAQYEAALRINPDHRIALNRLAWLRATSRDAAHRNGVQALQLAQHSSDLTDGKDPAVQQVLAAAEAENGRFQEAADTARKAKTLTAPQDPLRDLLEADARRYELRLPARE